MNRKILVFLLALVTSSQYDTWAQSSDSVLTKNVPTESISTNITSLKGLKQFQLNLGTQGIGAAFRYGITPSITAKIGLSFLPVKAANLFNFPRNINHKSEAKAEFHNAHIVGEFDPFKKNWIRVVAGGAYFIKKSASYTVIPTDQYTYGEMELTEEEVGKVVVNAKWKSIAPYLGISLFPLTTANKINYNLELGTYYLSRPNITVDATGLLAPNKNQEALIESNMKSYNWLPVLQFSINYKL